MVQAAPLMPFPSGLGSPLAFGVPGLCSSQAAAPQSWRNRPLQPHLSIPVPLSKAHGSCPKDAEKAGEQQRTGKDPAPGCKQTKNTQSEVFTSMIMQFTPARCSPEGEAGRAVGSTSFPGNIPGGCRAV